MSNFTNFIETTIIWKKWICLFYFTHIVFIKFSVELTRLASWTCWCTPTISFLLSVFITKPLNKSTVQLIIFWSSILQQNLYNVSFNLLITSLLSTYLPVCQWHTVNVVKWVPSGKSYPSSSPACTSLNVKLAQHFQQHTEREESWLNFSNSIEF